MSGSPPADDMTDISNLMAKDRAAAVAAAAAATAAAAVAAASAQYEQQQRQQQQQQLQLQPELLGTTQELQPPPLDRGNSPHASEASYNSSHRPFDSPSTVHVPLSLPDPNATPNLLSTTSLPPVNQTIPMSYNTISSQPDRPQPVKQFQCSTCPKRFARRSDLARHERIHSGVRPHVCDFEGCGKQFIQRSALTVHKRVHTGEKPHFCERCGKPFSDSSSLARHRRIHLGTRPYQCQYANCQKTFTRKTTLTRHQMAHTETLQEAAVATAKKLSEQASKATAVADSMRADGREGYLSYTNVSPFNSPFQSPSPGQKQASPSPGAESAVSNAMRNDYSHRENGTLPVHGQSDMSLQTPASTSALTPGMQPTSHPTNYLPSNPTYYLPPPVLEPSVEPHQSTPGSTGGSPHLASIEWQSPHPRSPSHIPSPTFSNSGGNNSIYPELLDPALSTLSPVYAFGPQARRYTNTEPASTTYDVKPPPSELWAGP